MRDNGKNGNGHTGDLTVRILGKIHERLGDVVKAQTETNHRLEHVEKELGEVEKELGEVRKGLGEVRKGLGEVKVQLTAQTERLDRFLVLNYERVTKLESGMADLGGRVSALEHAR